jgi:predicted nucleotidyltransferase
VSTTIRSAEIDARLTTLGSAIAEAAPAVEFAYLFGSAATGTMNLRSDVDVAIHVAASADAHRTWRDVVFAVSKHLGTDAVDVVLLNTAPISVAGRVLGSRRVLIDRAPFVRHTYESVTARLFHDFRIREHRSLAIRYPRG